MSKNADRSVRGSLNLTLYKSLVKFTKTTSVEFWEGELVQEKIGKEQHGSANICKFFRSFAMRASERWESLEIGMWDQEKVLF